MEYYIPRSLPDEEKLQALDRIAAERFTPPLTLKNWQREIAKELLSGNDAMLLAPTGGGKSLLFYLYAIARPTEFILVVSPLKMLEKDMIQKLTKREISAVALNADTVSQAHREGRDIWKECKRGDYQVVLCSPELLPEPRMNELLTHGPFRQRVRLVVVDEAHLIPTWGGDTPGRQAFRRAFSAIGSLRSQLDSQQTVFLALSATLMPGAPVATVEQSLGFRKGRRYKFDRQDCERKNIFIILRRIREGASDGSFWDIFWVLHELLDSEDKDPKRIPKTIIYVDSILKGWQIVLFLRRLLPAALQPQADKIIRHIHASTCGKCKDEILSDFSAPDGSALRIIVATDAFGCGIDIQDVARVIIFGTPRDLDSAYQRLGRLARAIESGWGYIYVNAALWDKTCTRLGVIDRIRSRRVRGSNEVSDSSAKESACPYFMQVLEAHLQGQCFSKVINRLYANSQSGQETNCGRCSGCVDDKLPEVPAKPVAKKRAPLLFPWLKKSHTRGGGRIKKPVTDNANRKLTAAALRTFLSIPVGQLTIFSSREDFLPDKKISELAKHLRDLDSSDSIQQALGSDWTFWDSCGEALVAQILCIRGEMLAEHKTMQAQGVVGDDDEPMDGEHGSESEDEGNQSEEDSGCLDSQVPAAESIPPCCPPDPPRLIIRLRPPRSLNHSVA